MAMFVPQSRTIRQKGPRKDGFAGPCAGFVNFRNRICCVLDRNVRIDTNLALEGYTPTLDRHPRRIADFATLGEALDYAAEGNRGMNFHDARGNLLRAYP